jgi:ferredoxin-NADP reductase
LGRVEGRTESTAQPPPDAARAQVRPSSSRPRVHLQRACWRSLERAALLDRLTPVLQRAPGKWQIATVIRVKQETPRVKSFSLRLPMWLPHLPGQHYDVRLTAADGYRAQRSYSVASSPLDEGQIELTIDRLDDGEVSPYFHDVVAEGDTVEVRGPLTSYFVWRGESPALLVGGGSGVVPLMAMLRHRRRAAPHLEMRLVYSVRSADDLIYADELPADARLTFTRHPPVGWKGHTGRIDSALIADVASGSVIAFVCGSDGFVENASRFLIENGLEAERIRTERFGPSA